MAGAPLAGVIQYPPLEIRSMTSAFAGRFDDFSHWRAGLGERLDELSACLADIGFDDRPSCARLAALRERLDADKLIVAFVAEFSRGKSELINAIFFADAGTRVLPAAPGRTTMCPVELAWDPHQPEGLSLLPMGTRLEDVSLTHWRDRRDAWTHLLLDKSEPESLSLALRQVTATRQTTIHEAQALGLWHESNGDHNAATDQVESVEVPVWRHAMINHPHPLLRQGLVVLDTPGLNALGAEPELTLGLLPLAHATVFIVGADTGVTQSDLTIWRDHLGARQGLAFVVLNKIDALRDPLATPEQVDAQIEAQRRSTARILGVPPERVFALSARQGLVARIEGDAQGLSESRLIEFEAALSVGLLPQRRQLLGRLIEDAAQHIHHRAVRHIGEALRQQAEQLLELRGLRGQSSAKLTMLMKRVSGEAMEFEQCHARLTALRAMHARQGELALAQLSYDDLEEEIDLMLAEIQASVLRLGARKAFVALCERLRERLLRVQTQLHDTQDMLGGTFGLLNAQFGFGLALKTGPNMTGFIEEISLIERLYAQYLGLGDVLRLTRPRFTEQLRRMLVERISVVWDGSRNAIEGWNREVASHIDAQLVERRRGFQKRAESLSRVRGAADQLELRIAEIEQQERQLRQQLEQLGAINQSLLRAACDAVDVSASMGSADARRARA